MIPKTAWILMAWMALVYPATVMLRQHYLMDVYAGLFVGFRLLLGVHVPRQTATARSEGRPHPWPGT